MPKPITADQLTAYSLRAFDCSDRNLRSLLIASIRRNQRPLPDLRRECDHVRYRRLQHRFLLAKRWLSVRRLTGIRKPSRKLMGVA